MADKHYDITYLQHSAQLLSQLKEYSYTFFEDLTEGIIVDLGCGTGSDIMELSKKVAPSVKLVGVDHDPVMIQEAVKQAGTAEDVTFILSEAYHLPFDDNSISGLRNERVIQHLQRPEDAIQEIKRVLRAHAPLVCIETDWHSLSFYTKYVETQNRLTDYLTGTKVNNGYSAQKLLSLLTENGFGEIRFSIHPVVINNLDEGNIYFRIKDIVEECIKNSVISEQEGVNFYDALVLADRKGYFGCSINLVAVSGIKLGAI
jgi:ubiquinone/menaquinone biosynthesis C-methylase UbiE